MTVKFPKYNRVEIIFFITYFYVFRLLTNFEYNFWEEKKVGVSRFDVEISLIYGTSSLIAFLVFYEIVKRYLENRRLLVFISYTLIFLIGYSIFQKASSYLFAHLNFLSPEMKKWAMTSFKAKAIGYSLAYMFKEFLSIGCLAYFIYSAKQDERMRVLKEQQLISELTYLKTQLQPHFFFNTINNIYSLALKQSKDTAPLVAKLAEMMRYILYQSVEPFVLLKDEIAFIRNYVEVEKIRYRAAIHINFEAQGIDNETKISPLLVLPFIENAFKHGVEEEEEKGFVHIIICKTEDELTMEVSNSISKSRAITGGIGLVNVKKRLSILYPNQYKLEMQNDENTYYVTLSLKIK